MFTFKTIFNLLKLHFEIIKHFKKIIINFDIKFEQFLYKKSE